MFFGTILQNTAVVVRLQKWKREVIRVFNFGIV